MTVCVQLRDALESHVADGAQELDMAVWMIRTSLELVGQGGLGISFEQLVPSKMNRLAASVILYSYVVHTLDTDHRVHCPFDAFLAPLLLG